MIEYTNEDCMIGMAQYPDNYFDLAIVDPPYQGNDAIGRTDSKQVSVHAAKRTKYKLFENIAPNESYFEELKRVSKNQIVWGGNFFGLCGGVIVWNKHGTAFGEGEIAICSTHKSVRFYDYVWNGMLQGDMKNKEMRLHPTQKPVALYKWLLKNYAKQGDKILDTHVGSASSLIACYDMGFDAVGFELDPDYYAASKRRLEDFMRQPKLEELVNTEYSQPSLL
jgi:site-specific DNA-methyltransferase (adenine-specific)